MSLVGPLADSHHPNGSHSVHDQVTALRWARLRLLRHTEREKENTGILAGINPVILAGITNPPLKTGGETEAQKG